jgi:hypothetical protein
VDHHIGCVAKVLGKLCATLKARACVSDPLSIKISLGDLIGAIIEEGFIARIEQVPSPANDVGLEGLFYKKRFDQGKKIMGVICYDEALVAANRPSEIEARRRFIVAKELSHIFDEDGELTSTAPEILDLMSTLISERVLDANIQARADHNARLLAIEMIIPFERRIALLAKGPPTGAIVQQLALDCCFPAEYTRIALDPVYNTYVAKLRKKARVTGLAA